MMLIFGPLVAPRISAVTSYLATSPGALTTLSPSTTRSAGSVTVEPISPANLSTVTTSSTATFSCLPPQRTIAYTAEPFLCVPRARLIEQKLNWKLLPAPIGRGASGALTTAQERRKTQDTGSGAPRSNRSLTGPRSRIAAPYDVSPRRPRSWHGASAG